MKNVFCCIILTITCLSVTYSQNLRGRVCEINEQGDTAAVTAAALQWLHTAVGTYTDANGVFSIPRAKTDTLLVSFPSYEAETLKITPVQQDITIYLSRIHALSEVQVVARDGSFISTQPILTTVITQQGLRRAACCNLAESFESTVAVDMEYADAVTGAKQISMLGLAGIYSQILLENVPYIRLLTQQFGLGFVPGSWMESISVSKGVASVTNGYEAITGQVNVDYKKPETNNERVFLNLYGNSMGKGELNFNTRLKVGRKDDDNAATMLFLSLGDQFAKMDMNGDSFLDAPLNRQLNVMNRWDVKVPGKYVNRTLAGFVWDDRAGGQTGNSFRAETLPDSVYGIRIDNKKVDVITKNGFLLKGEDESIGTILSYSASFAKAQFGKRHFDATQHSFYANVLYSNKFGALKRHKLTAGASLSYDGYSERVARVATSDSLFHTASHQAVPGIFGEYCYIIEPKLVVMAGLRFDYDLLYHKLLWTPRLHLKWQATDNFSLRLSAGKGYRTAYVLAENVSLLASSRSYNMTESLHPEEAFNTGISLVQRFNMPGGKGSVSVDYFYTAFMNQVIVDLDRDVHAINVYNLNGNFNGTGNRSRSHSVQMELTLKPVSRLELLFAYRYNDVRYMSGGVMREKALTSPHKGLFNIHYSTRYDRWSFNLTLQVNGPQRLPDTQNSPEMYRRAEYSKTYCIMNAQITKKFRRWEIYVGGENLLNYKQKDPIISSDNPFGEYFDATVIYAPITGIMGYAGVRFILK